MRIRRDLRDALKDRALEVQLQHDAEDAGESWINSDRRFSASTLPLSSNESMGGSGFGSPAGGSSVYAVRGGQNARCTAGLSSNRDRNTTMPSTMDDRRDRKSTRLNSSH